MEETKRIAMTGLRSVTVITIVLGLRPGAAMAQAKPETVRAPGVRPPFATARCTDMTWSSSTDRQLACVQHGGVRFWLRPRRPPNVTGLCGDGSVWTGPDLQSACAGRGGVAEWYGGPGGPLPMKDSPPPRLRVSG